MSNWSVLSTLFPCSFKPDPEHHEEGVVPPPNDPGAPGEMGKPVKLDNPSPEVKALIDEGWKNNAFNQYASDIISLHRSLPDPRDEWYFDILNFFHVFLFRFFVSHSQ
jgi:polypeptide N-acetylgalactosaminyltransferase